MCAVSEAPVPVQLSASSSSTPECVVEARDARAGAERAAAAWEAEREELQQRACLERTKAMARQAALQVRSTELPHARWCVSSPQVDGTGVRANSRKWHACSMHATLLQSSHLCNTAVLFSPLISATLQFFAMHDARTASHTTIWPRRGWAGPSARLHWPSQHAESAFVKSRSGSHYATPIMASAHTRHMHDCLACHNTGGCGGK